MLGFDFDGKYIGACVCRNLKEQDCFLAKREGMFELGSGGVSCQVSISSTILRDISYCLKRFNLRLVNIPFSVRYGYMGTSASIV